MPRPGRSHDTTSKVVLQTVAAYEQSADKYLSCWGRRRYRKPPLLRQLLALLPKEARLPDLGCGVGQDARHLRKEGYSVVGLDRTGALRPPAFTYRSVDPGRYAPSSAASRKRRRHLGSGFSESSTEGGCSTADCRST
ncbi:methyltransferase domain-containing protein [Petrachloros mirabilis]